MNISKGDFLTQLSLEDDKMNLFWEDSKIILSKEDSLTKLSREDLKMNLCKDLKINLSWTDFKQNDDV